MGEKESKLAARNERKRPNPNTTEISRRLPCENGQHRESQFHCAKINCQVTLCANCAPTTIRDEIHCSLCLLSLNNLDMKFDEDEVNGFSADGMIKP